MQNNNVMPNENLLFWAINLAYQNSGRKKHLLSDRIKQFLELQNPSWTYPVQQNYKFYSQRLGQLFKDEYIEDINASRLRRFNNDVAIKAVLEDGSLTHGMISLPMLNI